MLLLLLPVLSGCDYSLTQNFITVEKPEANVKATFDLNAASDGTSILIDRERNVEYAFFLEGKNISKLTFSLGGKTWETTSDKGSIYIDESTYPSGKYTLKVQFYAATGSGSIADQLGAEFYAGEKSWPVVIDYGMQLPQSVTHRTTAQRQCELLWTKPVLSHLKVLSYTVEAATPTRRYTLTVPADDTSCIDPQQVGEATTYQVFATLSDETDQSILWHLGTMSLPDQCKLYVSGWNLTNVKVRWELPYACRPTLRIDEETPVTPAPEQQELEVPVTTFGSNAWWDLHKVVMTLRPATGGEEVMLQKEIKAGSPGYYVAAERGATWCYNPVTQLYYALTADHLHAYRYGETTPVRSGSGLSGGTIISSRTAPLLAVAQEDHIEILDAATLAVKQRIEAQWLLYDSRQVEQSIFFTADNRLMYVTTGVGSSHQVHVYDVDGGHPVSTIAVTGGYLRMASDGKHLFSSEDFELKVIELEQYQEKRRYTLPVPYELHSYTLFHLTEPSLLVVPDKSRGVVELRRCTDYGLVRSITLDKEMYFNSSDPVTGRLLVNNNTQLSVLSPRGESTLFTVPCPYSVWPKLTGDCLISFDGYLLHTQKIFLQ